MRIASPLLTCVSLLSMLATWAVSTPVHAQSSLGFDELPGMAYETGSLVPAASKLSDQYLDSHGVAFRSQDVPYVAVANLDRDFRQSVSPPNAIGGVSAGNKIDYALPIYLQFFLPGDSSKPAVTNFVSVRVDASGSNSALVFTAFDLVGTKLESVIAFDVNGPTLELSRAGIHTVEIRGGPGSSFDDITFQEPREGRVTGDCNQNGAEDGVDIANGASADENGNGKPDECEIPPATPVWIDFDDLPGMPSNTGTPVPASSSLSDQYLASHGVIFKSAEVSYIAVTAIDPEFVPSPPNAVGGVTQDDRIDYAVPIRAEFFLPGEPTKRAVTNFVSIRADTSGSGSLLALDAFDLEGRKLDSIVLADTGGPTLAVSAPGIHSIELRGGFGSSFDDFKFHPVTSGGTITDCNLNGNDDLADIAAGTSADLNGNEKPDECEPTPAGPVVELRQSGVRCVSLVLTTPIATKGGEVGIAYDPTMVTPLRVKPGADLESGSQVHFSFSPPSTCSAETGVAAGLTLGWVNPVGSDNLMEPGVHEIARLCFAMAAGAPPESCSVLRFVSCLGVSAAPVRNIVTDANGKSVPLVTADGEICPLPDLPFRRGDANGDGAFDISDPIGILGCLFLGTECATCADSTDANDDGLVNIGDPVYLLSWRFLAGAQPPSPFPECGADGTADALDDCEAMQSCP